MRTVIEETAPVRLPAVSKRLVGTLRSINDNGYGFLFIGRGLPNHFIHCSQLPPEAWVKGAIVEFTPTAARPGSSAPRVADVVLLKRKEGL